MGDITRGGEGLPFRFDPRRHTCAPKGHILLTPTVGGFAGLAPAAEKDAPARRHTAQLEELVRAAPNTPDEPLIIPLADRYMKVAVSSTQPGEDLLGVTSLNGEPALPSPFLYLFSVLVALEWRPSRRTLGQLASAAAQASDLLYDATDGQMAFGQVVIADRRFMRCADVQVLASNRYYPRSWIDGLMDELKYTPIRIGRGWWEKAVSVAVPWSEPIGPRVLVHEWCHYALGLKDEYLTKDPIPARIDSDSKRLTEDSGGSHRITFIRPQVATESLMDNLEGASEIIPQKSGPRSQRRAANQLRIRSVGDQPEPRFGDVDLVTRVLEGPDHLPLELPAIVSYAGPEPLPLSDPLAGADPQEHLWKPSVEWESHSWLYLLRPQGGGWSALIPQGSLDAQTALDGFWLLGAQDGDQLVVIGKQRAADRDGRPLPEQDVPPRVWRFPLRIRGAALDVDDAGGPLPLPDSLPVITVIPGRPRDVVRGGKVVNTERITQMRVRVAALPPHILDDPARLKLWVFPLGEEAAAGATWPRGAVMSREGDALVYGPFEAPSLDGQVLIEWDGALLIADYSQGGGPTTHVRAPEPPISAGSSDGNAMIYFAEPDYHANPSHRFDHSRIRVITTRNYGGFEDADRRSPRSYLYSVASSSRIPVDGLPTARDTRPEERAPLFPTLVLSFNRPLEGPGEPFIYRYSELLGHWQRLPTYVADGAPRAAYPLDRSGRTGFALEPSDEQAYHFRLFLADSEGGAKAM